MLKKMKLGMGICIFANLFLANVWASGSPDTISAIASSNLKGKDLGEVSSTFDRSWKTEVKKGIAEQEYYVGHNGKGLQAPNRAHNLRTYFSGSGVMVMDRTSRHDPNLFQFNLQSLSRGQTAIRDIADGAVYYQGNRVEIRRPNIVEWYINSSKGLEQGFNIDERPLGDGELCLSLSISGATASLNGDVIRLMTASGRVLRYSELVVVDANGHTLPSRLTIAATGGTTIKLLVDDSRAVYPIVIDPLLTATADAFVESNQASAGMGYSVVSAGDVNGDGYSDVLVGAPYYDNGETDEGAVFVFLGSASGITGTSPSDAHAVLESNQASAAMGWSVSSAGDVNGDGYSDIIVGAYDYDSGESDEGAALVYLGSASGITGTNPSGAHAVLESNQASAGMGWSVSSAGDVNGDGYDDVIVGAYIYANGESDEGTAFVFLGSASGITGTNPVDAHAAVESDQASAAMGWSVSSAGDVNGDGYGDIIVGACYYANGETAEGAAFVYLGSASGITGTTPADAHAAIESDQAFATMGWSVSSAGDVNGDGYGDIIVGAHFYANGESYEGAAFVYLGSSSGITGTNPADASATLESNQVSALMGHSVASAGDVNGDGFSDIIVGATDYDSGEANEGAAFVYLGSASGISGTNPADAYAVLESDQASAGMGSGVSSAGDVNGDGYGDIIVGATNYDNSESDEGASFVYLGGASGISGSNPSNAQKTIESNQADAEVGYSVSSAGDVNGDGYGDIIVGAYMYDNGETDEGAAFVYFGSAAGIAGTNPTDAHAVIESNQANAALGASVSSAGDVNGDGYGDILVGSSSFENGEAAEGAAFVYLGSASGITGTNPTNAHAVIESNQASTSLGASVSSADDVNGDGYGDIIVGAYMYDNGEANEGAAFVYLGGAAGITGTNPTNAHAVIESNQANAALGDSVSSAGDVNGDGYGDILVGANSYDGGEISEGAVFVYHGNGGINGKPPLVSQWTADGTSQVQRVGLSRNDEGFQVSIQAFPIGDYRQVKLQVEACPDDSIWGDGDCVTAVSANWSSVTADHLPSGLTLQEHVSGLITGLAYHWRARILYGPDSYAVSGIISSANPAHGPWRRFHAQAANNDILVKASNDPVATDDASTTDEDAVLTISVTANDTDVDGDTLTVSSFDATSTNGGTVTDGGGGNLDYSPAQDFNGTDSFGYTISDGNGGTATATVTITVNSVNDAPVADAQSITVDEDSTGNAITLTGSDVDGAIVSYSVISAPSHGTLSGTAPDLSYAPEADFSGTDSFTFRVNDGSTDSPTATVSITVNPVNDPPLANAQSVIVEEDSIGNAITLTGSDVDGAIVSYSVISAPSHGTLSGTAPDLSYAPETDFSGTDSFTFRVNDGYIDSSLATVTITVNAVNDAPVADAQSIVVDEDSTDNAITLTGTDMDGDTLTYTIASGPSHGTLSGTAPDLLYTPEADYYGDDAFTFSVNDGTLDSAQVDVDITVNDVAESGGSGGGGGGGGGGCFISTLSP